ncbi:MAG: phenylalanine--tRNA ligase subunit beta [Verrucomicrobiota bacterium]
MKFSLKWLQEWVEINVDVPTLVDRLTLSGTEVEKVESKGIESDFVVVAEIRSFVPHPNADRLRLCRVFDGKDERQIVCGAKNFKEGDKAPLALPGAKLPGGLTIKVGKLRGETSEGMMCSEVELNYAEQSEGILILPADAPVGTPLHRYISGDTTIEVEITPNRGDLCSYRGMARELVAIGVATWKSRTEIASPSWGSVPSSVKVQLNDSGCPYYTGVRLQNVKVAPSPQWLQEKIVATGHQPINNVVDITNLILWELGQPLHAFDLTKLQGGGIEIRKSRTGEKFGGLDGKTYELNGSELVIADASSVVALAGVMGGVSSGVSDSTTEIFLECAWFEPAQVRTSAKRHALTTDSSYRFERRVDAAGALDAINRAIALLIELTGATLNEAPLIGGSAPSSVSEMTLRLDRANRFLSADYTEETISALLESLGIEKLGVQGNELRFRSPSYRPDLREEIDLFEEVARIRGMSAVPSRLLFRPQMAGVVDEKYVKISKLRQALAAKGWNECLTDPLLSRDRATGNAEVELLNPLNEQFSHLRSHLRPSLLNVASVNQSRGNNSLRLFEVGRIFTAGTEKTVLGLLITGISGSLHWIDKPRPLDEFDLRGVMDYLLQLGITEKEVLNCGPVIQSEKKAFGLKGDVFYAEIDLGPWSQKGSAEPTFQALPVFPAVRRDIALVVLESLPYREVSQAIQSAQVPQLERVELFDRFQDPTGVKVPAGHQSIAVALTYRAADKTLTDQEVNQFHDRVKQSLIKKTGAVIRES